MKQIFIALLFCISISPVTGQKPKPIYLEFPTVPPFKLSAVNSQGFISKKDLKKHKPVLLFIFDPSCDHCHNVMKELIADITLFKKVQIVMASQFDSMQLKSFSDMYAIDSYNNILLGRDSSGFLINFYGFTAYPALYLYDKKGKFIRAYKPGEPMSRIAAELND